MKHAVDAVGKRARIKQLALFVLIRAGILLLLLIPAYIAIATYVIQKNAPQEDNTPVFDAMQLTGPTGAQIRSTPTGDTLLSVFLPLIGDAVETDGVPDSHRAGRYVASMSENGTHQPYTFFFSPDSEDCYYVTPDETVFVATAHEKTALFLNSSYAFELYTGAKIPTMTTAATDEIIPTGAQWYYRTENGLFTELTHLNVTSETRVYPIANDVAFYFSTQPDTHEVVIRHNAEELYRGDAQGISLALADHIDFLDFEISATFAESADKAFYGTLSYRFRMEVVEAAHFTPDRLSVPSGGFFIVQCENVKNVDKLQVTLTTAKAPPVIFEKDGLAYIAFPVGTAGQYQMNITYGTITATFDFTATATGSTHHTATTAALYQNFSALLRTHLPILINEKGAAVANTALLPRGTFLAYTEDRAFAYGDTLTVDGEDLSDIPLPFDLYCISGDVPALSAGRVLEIGVDEYIGKYVILDHGCGLYTWYAGLLEFRVQKDDYVQIGQAVGVASDSPDYGKPVLVMATLGKGALSVDYLTEHTFQWIDPKTEP